MGGLVAPRLFGTRNVLCAAASLLLAALVSSPAVASALEPRFDHRDQQGVLAELGFVRDSVTTGDGVAVTAYRPILRLAYGFDVSGQGDELLLGGGLRLDAWDDHRPELIRFTLDARYRGYFGTEELKTFFDAGLSVPVSPRFSIGPRIGLGVIYDFGRAGGIFASAAFATGLGQVRLASFELSAGGQLRW